MKAIEEKDVNYMISVMKAHTEGKKIECQIWGHNDWTPVDDPEWNWQGCDYRVKPEPKKQTYRPYKSTEELIADYRDRFDLECYEAEMPLIWVQTRLFGYKSLITVFGDGNVFIGDIAWKPFKDLFERFTYLNGTPCGKLVEE